MSDELITSVSSTEEIQVVPDQVVPEQPAEQNREVEGLTKGIQAEREKRQLAEQKAQLLESMLYQQQMAQAQQPKQEEVLSEYNPDDLITVRAADKIVDSKLSKIQQQMRQELLNQQVELAKAKYNDYNDVIALFDQMAKEDPEILNVVMASKNPAERAYKIGRSSDEYQQKIVKKATESVTQKIAGNLDKPPTLSTMAGNSPQFVAKDYSKMSDAEIDSEVRKVRGY